MKWLPIKGLVSNISLNGYPIQNTVVPEGVVKGWMGRMQ
jgi:hypothetical protein